MADYFLPIIVGELLYIALLLTRIYLDMPTPPPEQ
jgi:hypothetical protein